MPEIKNEISLTKSLIPICVLISLLAHSTITKKEIDLELTKSVINKIVKNTKKKININYIQEIVSKFFNISIEQMKDKARRKEIVIARQVAMYFSKDFTNNSLKSIGFHFGGRDHSTVIHAVQSVNDMIDTNPVFKNNIENPDYFHLIHRKCVRGKRTRGNTSIQAIMCLSLCREALTHPVETTLAVETTFWVDPF